MIVQMLIGEIRDPRALQSCELAFAEKIAAQSVPSVSLLRITLSCG